MTEQEYIVIETRISKTLLGIAREDKLISKASNLSEEFKNDVWEDYLIDIDELELK